MSEAKNPSIDWPPQNSVKFVVGFDNNKEDINFFNVSGYIEIPTWPNEKEKVNGDGPEK